MAENDGATALQFLADVERAYDEAAGGKYRAYNLIVELDRIGIELKRKPGGPVVVKPASDGEG